MFLQIKKILSEVKPYKRQVVIIAVTGIIYSLSYSRMGYLVKELFDALSGVGKGAQEDGFVMGGGILRLAPVVLALALISSVARYFHTFTMNYLGECVVQNLRQKLQAKFMHLSLSYHTSYAHGSGGLISRILNDIRTIQESLRIIADVFLHPLLFIFLIGNLIAIDWKLTLFVFTAIPLVAVVLKSIGKSVRKYTPKWQVSLEQMTSVIKESLDGVRIIQSFGLESEMSEKLKKTSEEYLFYKKKHISRQEAAGPTTEFIAAAVILLVIVYIHLQIEKGLSTPGAFVGFVTSLLMINQPIKRFQEAFVRIQEVSVAIDRIYEILDSSQEVPRWEKPLFFPKEWSLIEYKDVHFKYENEWILKGVSFQVRRGEVVAFVGESGSGKSTLVNLLERFYDPTKGSILVDGVDIRKFDLPSLRKNIALVSQDVFLFKDSIERNIWAGDFSKNAEGIVPAAKMANAHSFILKTPLGYENSVGEKGGLLSGGEKQRISIARAFFKDSPVIVLDEATSALDNQSEREIQKGLDTLMEGRTAFVIAHRLSTIQHAHRIFVLHRGVLREEGTHVELLEKKGLYSELYLKTNLD